MSESVYVPPVGDALGYRTARPPDGTHFGSSPYLNCSECGGALVCHLRACANTIHRHSECHDYCNAEDKFRKRWWKRWYFKQRVAFEFRMALPRVKFFLTLLYYRLIVAQRIGWKHGRMSPACVWANRNCIVFRYAWNETLMLRPIGWTCIECGWVIEGDWREMQRPMP